MKNIHSIEFYTGSKEELLPGFEKDFPYIASRAELDKYIGCYVPWHWHRTVELFYMESSSIEYDTPEGKYCFRLEAAAAYLSERECYRVFHDCLHMTPVEYITTYRLQVACQMLAKGQEAVTVISHECGLGSSSYFGKVFREYAHCSPIEYRKKWQNSDR